MSKLIGRLIGFLVFACVFIGAVAAILAVSTGLVDLRQVFPGLPEPPPIETGNLPLPGVEVPEIEVPPVLQPGESIPLQGFVRPRPLLARIPAPQQLSTDPRVIGTNFFLAVLMALIFGATSTVLGNMLRDEEPRLREWLKVLGVERLFGWLKGAFQWSLGHLAVQRGCLTLPLVLVIFALYGIIFAFLEEGTSIVSREGIILAVTLAFTAGLVSFGGDIARRIMAWLWHKKSRFNLYPANLIVAAGTVILSRVLHLSPGIVFGTPGGAEVDMPEDHRERREVTLAYATLIVLAVIGGAGWAVSGVILSMLDVPFDGRLVPVMATVFNLSQDASLALFLTALETLFFESLPLAYGTGRTILKWSKIGWAATFLPIAFLFNHAVLNPQSGFLDSFMSPNVRFLWFILIVLVGVTAGLWFYFNVLDDILKQGLGIRTPAPADQSTQQPPYDDRMGGGQYPR